MSRLIVRLWVYLLVPLPVATVCAACYTWQLGYTADILAPVSLAAVCGVAFVAAWRSRS